MATGTGCAYILDLWADDPQQSSNMVDGLLRTPPTENSTILLLAGVSSKQPDTVKTALAAQHLERVVTFENEDKMAVFYKAKLYLDKHNISVLFILCSNKCSRYWHLILSSMLTNVYEWTIKAVDQAEAEIPSEEQVTNDVTSFFGSLSTFDDIITLKSPIIPSDLFYHGFSCRTGGLSHLSGMKSLNLVFSHAKRDSKILVSENRRKLANHVGFNPEKFFVARAVHGNYVHVVGKTEAEGFDGIVTDQPGITIGAPGADCVTLVFADPVKRACAALHSGWKGTVKRACVEVLRTMTKEFGSNPSDVIVAMGPSIGQCCFEFDVDQSGQFTDIVAEAVEVRDGGNKAYVNLQLCNRVLLEQNGVKPNNIDDATCTKCTSCNSDLFFSYRRDGRPFGNQLGFIGIAIKDAPPPTEHK